MDRLRTMLKPRMGILLVWLMGFVFFAHNAHLQLATDDLGWLRGEAPTVFDQYRLIPRLVFVSLNRITGPSPLAALAVIFLFHSANTILIHSLVREFFKNTSAALAAAWIFMINPLTLGTLTWISCFSYVLGTTLALLGLFFFWQGRGSSRRSLWWAGAVVCYGAGLLTSHEVLFVPAIFFLWSWLWGGDWFRRGGLVAGLAMGFGLLIYFFFYNFERFGVETARLFSFGFLSAFASSALSFGLSLGLAYPISFFVSPTGFLQFTFSEPIRWSITLAFLIGMILLYRPNKNWRTWLVLALSFAALITPYILRLYLMPRSVNYDISYVLSGRVFYLPFIVISILGGVLTAQLCQTLFIKSRSLWKFSYALPAGAYLYALCILYGPQDFAGLSVLHGTGPGFPPSWNPYYGSQPIWLTSLALIAVAAYIRIVMLERSN